VTATQVEPYPAGPAADGRDLPYWQALRNGQVVVQQCRRCQTWLPGTRTMCTRCHSFHLSWNPVVAEGRVFTWCRSHHSYMSELADLNPYVSVVVELPGAGGVRVLGMLDPDSDDVAIGDPVVGSIVEPPNSQWPVLRWTRVARTEGDA
jgi:uncharacterized OB-fold protein